MQKLSSSQAVWLHESVAAAIARNDPGRFPIKIGYSEASRLVKFSLTCASVHTSVELPDETLIPNQT